MKPASEHTEPGHPTLAEAVRRAIDVVDPSGRSDALADLERRFEDRDEPLSGALPTLDRELGEGTDAVDPQAEDGSVVLASAVVTYLAHKRDETESDREDLIRRTIKAEFDGNPPPSVEEWIAEEKLSV